MVILKVFMRFWQKTTPFNFWSIDELEEVLTLFYEKNTIMRYIHRCNLPPNIFLECWNKGLIEQNRDEIKWKIKFKLKIPYNQISAIRAWSAVLCEFSDSAFSADELNFNKKTKWSGLKHLYKHRYKNSPLFVPFAKIFTYFVCL
jgi:hypothetical protein